MKIANKAKNDSFENIAIGYVFEFGDELFMKIAEILHGGEVEYNAVSLEAGSLKKFGKYALIRPVNGKFVIEV